MSFTDFVSRYQLARSEGLVLRYLTDAYRTLRQTVPDAHRTPELEDLVEWLGETVRQTDSSLLDEWEALADPEHVRSDVAHHEPPPPPRPISTQERAFTVMIRNAMFRRVELVARDDLDGLMRHGAAGGRPHRPAPGGRDDPLGVGRRDRGVLRRARRGAPRTPTPAARSSWPSPARRIRARGGSGRPSTTPRATTTG